MHVTFTERMELSTIMSAEKRKVEEDTDVLAKKIKVEIETTEEPEELGPIEGHEPQSREQENLRRNIQLWLERYQVLNPETACIGIKDLLSLRNIEDKNYEELAQRSSESQRCTKEFNIRSALQQKYL